MKAFVDFEAVSADARDRGRGTRFQQFMRKPGERKENLIVKVSSIALVLNPEQSESFPMMNLPH